MRNEKGITLISLVVTIVILIIITSVAINSGTESIEDVNKIAFISEMEMIQSKVNAIYEERKNDQSKVELYDEIGQDLSLIDNSKLEIILNGKNSNGFKYYRKEELKSLGLDNINQEVIINLNTREVINVNGINIDGSMYYTLSEIPDYTLYNVEYMNTNTDAPSFTVEQTKLGISEYRFTIKDIQYNSNVKGGTVSYKLHSDTNWILNGENTSFVVNKPGLYDIMFTDLAGNSTTVQKWFYVENGLVLFLDGENNTGTGHNNNATTWKDLSGYSNDAQLIGFSNTSQSGWSNNALNFDGVDDYCVIEDSESMKPIDQTIEVIINKIGEAQNKGDGRVIYFVRWLGYTMEIGTKYTYGRNQGVESYLSSETEVINNKINSVSGTHHNNLSKIYINGNFENSQEITPGEYTSMNETRIGTYLDRNFLRGNIYCIRMYDRELTSNEIRINYEIDKYRFGITD